MASSVPCMFSLSVSKFQVIYLGVWFTLMSFVQVRYRDTVSMFYQPFQCHLQGGCILCILGSSLHNQMTVVGQFVSMCSILSHQFPNFPLKFYSGHLNTWRKGTKHIKNQNIIMATHNKCSVLNTSPHILYIIFYLGLEMWLSGTVLALNMKDSGLKSQHLKKIKIFLWIVMFIYNSSFLSPRVSTSREKELFQCCTVTCS